MNSNLKNRLQNIICQIANIDKENLTLETDLSQLGIDSISLITIICLIEDKYGIVLQTEDIFQIKSFDELIKFVDKQIK
ncbi:TPA: acyl carrier protein [Streptococcus suis]